MSEGLYHDLLSKMNDLIEQQVALEIQVKPIAFEVKSYALLYRIQQDSKSPDDCYRHCHTYQDQVENSDNKVIKHLVENGYIEKTGKSGFSNFYMITPSGRELLKYVNYYPD